MNAHPKKWDANLLFRNGMRSLYTLRRSDSTSRGQLEFAEQNFRTRLFQNNGLLDVGVERLDYGAKFHGVTQKRLIEALTVCIVKIAKGVGGESEIAALLGG